MMSSPEEQPPDSSWLDESPDGSVSGAEWALREGRAETPTEYGLKLDKWGQRRGEELVDLGEFKAISAKPEDAADMFGMAFDYEPELNETCTDPHKLDYIKSMLSNDEYQALRGMTKLDVMASEFASLKFCQEWTTYKTGREKQDAKDKKEGKGQPSAKDQLRQEMKTAAAVGRAIEAAQEEVNALDDARQAMGIGQDGGDSQLSGMSPAAVKKMFQKVKSNQSLRKILDWAGRYRVAARAKQRIKVLHGYDDMVGVVLDNEVGRLLPAEMAALNHPILRVDAVRRFAERQMYCREYRGVENVAKGPIIVIVDESGSMSLPSGPDGTRIEHAKAFALAMAWVARHQKRWCAFVCFAASGQTRHLVLPPNKWPADAVMKWLENFMNGSSTVLPVREIPQLYEDMGAPKGKTDLICITDGETAPIPTDHYQQFMAWKARAQCKFIGISIASEARHVQTISDEFYKVMGLSPDNTAIERGLSI